MSVVRMCLEMAETPMPLMRFLHQDTYLQRLAYDTYVHCQYPQHRRERGNLSTWLGRTRSLSQPNKSRSLAPAASLHQPSERDEALPMGMRFGATAGWSPASTAASGRHWWLYSKQLLTAPLLRIC